MKKIAMLMSFCIIIQSVTYGYVVRDADIPSEKIIPFSFISDEMFFAEDISVKGLDNVKIEKVYVDNGEVNAYVDGNYISLEFDDGEKSNSIQTVTRSDTLEIEDMPLTDMDKFIIEAQSDREVKEITEVSGDFESANISKSGVIEIQVRKNATGIKGYDENKTEKSKVIVKIDGDNKFREVESEWITLEHEGIEDIKAISGDTSGVKEIILKNNQLKVLFNNGIPKLNETVVHSGHTYFWIDRDSDGIFKKYNPNSIYNTDKNKISGKGKYLDESEEEQLGMMLSNSNWIDYAGVEVNGVRYIYPFDRTNGIPDSSNGEILSDNFIEFSGQAFNTEKYTVYFSEDGVYYVPEGKLYSMGELVDGTSGWGEVWPNHDWESNETFLKELTGKNETYVKHYKFFYGPDDKKAFGGFYTYPYSCTIEYEHYKPVNLYSGQVVYTYDSEEYVRGYLYNGWIKISYTENKTINDYPPTSPYNVRYDSDSNIISWQHGTDDYTPESKLSYEMQVYTGSWGETINTDLGENSKQYKINYTDFDIRVRTVDEVGQVSEWTKLSDNAIELKGAVTPNIIKSGETVKITANTKSLSKISSIKAKSDELGIDTELYKISEEVPDYFEISYEIVADFLEENEYIYTDNERYVEEKDGRMRNYSFISNDKTDGMELNINFPDDIAFTKNGTIIIPNGNYLDAPLNIFRYSGMKLYLNMENELGIKNKVTGKKETFIMYENASERATQNGYSVIVFPGKLIINTFNYDENNKPKYIEIEVDKSVGNKPIIIRWNTDVYGITRFDISNEDQHIYSYSVDYNNLDKYANNIEYARISKYLKKYSLAPYGYINPSKKFTAYWAKIVLSVLSRYNVNEFPWLGYKVRDNEYVIEEYIINYNNNPAVRNTYRTLILDEYASDAAVKKYINLIKSTNFPIERNNSETVFADDVLDYNCEFEIDNVSTDSNVLPGKYDIELTATDVDGKSSKILLTVIVENDESQMYPEEEEIVNSTIKDILVGRFYYKNGQGYLEELKKYDKNSDTEGFISAGETLGFNFIADNVEFLEVDFIGDDSIKTLDSLTKLFLIEKPRENGKNVENIIAQYESFPKRIYPVNVNDDGESEFKYFYTIPYGTKQNIHSWSTLRNSTLEKIDTSKLFSRISDSYMLKITVNGNESISYEVPFDVFERWDTIINRDASEFITNSDTKWKIRIDK